MGNGHGDCVCCRRTLRKVMALGRKYCYLGASRLSCIRFIAHELLLVSVYFNTCQGEGQQFEACTCHFLLLLNVAFIYCKIY
jgi:hypothetical protein